MQKFIFVLFFGLVSSSSIPIWEFLKREEKEINIYSIFAKEVDNRCQTSDCSKDLLKYGLDKLKELDEGDLDFLDPYQHGGNKKIWQTLVLGHPQALTISKPQPTTTSKPNSYDDESFSDLQFGGSAKIDNVYRVAPPKNFVFTPVNSFEHGQYAVKVLPNGAPIRTYQSQNQPQDDDINQYRFPSRLVPYV